MKPPEFEPIITTGLSEQEAASILRDEGYNEIPSTKRRGVIDIALGVVREPMFLMLVAIGVLYIALGDLQEALIMLSFVFVIMGITFYQERKTERALEALRDLSSPRASVIRDGDRKRIAGRDVVRGDIVVLAEGDRVPADAVVLDATNLSADESLLTGESVPVRKVTWDGKKEAGAPGGDDLPFVYSGTLIVQGRGITQVTATGIRTEMGKIGKALSTVETERTPLQQETQRIVLNVASLSLFLCTTVIVVYGLTRGDWLNGVLAGLTLAMAILPEEFPVVLTVFLALGAWRISRNGVLTRRVPAVETLGSTTVLCVDKTGTLTMNQMSIRCLLAKGQSYEISGDDKRLPENFHELVEYSVLASQEDPFDPMEKAIRKLGAHYLSQTEHLHADWHLVREYPLSRDLLALSHVWQSPDGDELVIAAKGAPEAIADLCHFNRSQTQALADPVRSMADDGLRVLGVAKAAFKRTELPSEQHEFKFEFIGLLGLADPVRPTVPAAIKECYTAGIRVVMITGDYPGTAQSIARQIGLAPLDEYITGPELNQMDDLELQQRIRTVNIFARVVPEQKLRLVQALKANKEIVAMTGDGVNDAPALKAANIGIAMGGRGSDVARESSALVLLDDDFSSIVQAVRIGRRIFDNLRKAMTYIFAIHVPIAGLSLIPVLVGWPLILMPVHVVFLELIIDPACSIVFEAEPEEAGIMRRKPRRVTEPLFGRRTVWVPVLQGLSVLAVTTAVFGISLFRGQGELDARTLTFTTLILANLGLIASNRSWSQPILKTLRSRNAAQLWVVGGAIAFLAIVLLIPPLRDLFRFTSLHPIDLLISVGAALLSLAWFELYKLIRNRPRALA